MCRMSHLTNITIRGLQALSTYLTKYIADRCVHPNPFLINPEDRSLSACRTETFIAALLTEAWDALTDASETLNNCAYHHNISYSVATPLLYRALALYAISIYTYKYVYHAY
jgi:hypothetical protein